VGPPPAPVQPPGDELGRKERADRANAARRILEGGRLRPSQVARVVGYADRHLADAANPLNAANRRISITVRFQSKNRR